MVRDSLNVPSAGQDSWSALLDRRKIQRWLDASEPMFPPEGWRPTPKEIGSRNHPEGFEIKFMLLALRQQI